jgi:hypothetical protein
VRDADLVTVPVRAVSSGKGWHSLVLTHPALSATGMPFRHRGQLLRWLRQAVSCSTPGKLIELGRGRPRAAARAGPRRG